MITKRQVVNYVRNRDEMPAKEKAELFDPKNLPTTMRMLKDLKQDIDAQFIACDARLADMAATAATAERVDPDEPIRIQMGVDEKDNPIYEWHPPAIAEQVFKAKELRWQVRTKRFGYLIESAIEDAERAQSEVNDQRLSLLLAAVEKHRQGMEGDTGDEDEDLYAVAESLKARTA
jgi:hypothetical protein